MIAMETGWDLTVLVEDLQLTRRIRVRGDTHIGGLMLKLVESIEVKKDWSDHGFWWPEQNRWLLKTRQTLDQTGLYSDAKLEFHRMHETILLQLPDLQERLIRVNFSQSVFGVVVSVCRELGIRHPEELSLRRRVLLRQSWSDTNGTLGLGTRFRSFRRSKSVTGSSSQVEVRAGTLTNGAGRSGGFNSLMSRQASHSSSRSPHYDAPVASPRSVNSLVFEGAELTLLANSPSVSTLTAFTEKGLVQSRTLADRAVLNEFWLDSSRSLMEQGIRPSSAWDDNQVSLQLRYKFYAFYDLNVKYDSIRINQIYEQLKWSVLTQELECSEEEAMLLAALQLQVRLAAGSAPVRVESTLGRLPQLLDETDGGAAAGGEKVADDDIDAALADLEASLMSDAHMTLRSPKRPTTTDQSHEPLSSLNKIPELAGYLKLFKPRKYSLRSYRRYYFVLRETRLYVFPDQAKSRPIEELSLRSSQLTPDVNAATRKFGIRLFVANPEAPNGQMQEVWLRFDTKDQFAEWTAGINLASRGKSLASRTEFEAEARAIATQLDLQAPKPQPRLALNSALDIDPNDFIPQRHLRSRKVTSLVQRILARHANVRDRDAIEAKLEYIKVCQRLPAYGLAYFVVQCFNEQNSLTFTEFRKTRDKPKEELVGVAFDRLVRLDLFSGHIFNTWRFEELESWTVNWEVLNLQLRLSRSPLSLVLAPCPMAAAGNRQLVCKILAEFVGGNVFMSLRKPDKSQDLNEQLFHKLTAYRDPSH